MSDWFLQTHRAEASQRIAKLEFRTGCSTPLPAPTRQRVEDGGDRRDRTDDLMLAKHALSQLSYVPDGCTSEPKARKAEWPSALMRGAA